MTEKITESKLLQHIGLSLGRIFKKNDLIEWGLKNDLSEDYLSAKLSKMVRNGSIQKLFRGYYVLPNALLSGPPLHEFELIQTIAEPAALCCGNAMAVHGLTDQFSRNIYILTSQNHHSSQYIYQMSETNFILIRVRTPLFFGIEQRFIHESPFYVTDLERTLIDGLVRPQYCGGFFEVIHAFEQAFDRVDYIKLLNYAERFGKGTQKRLGWVLETLNLYPEGVVALKSITSSSVYRLDLTQNNQGEWLSDWNLIRNF